MEWISSFIEIIRHLDVHLNQLALDIGPWFYLAMMAIIFCETGLVVTPFLPGDSLLFALGALTVSSGSGINPWFLGLLLWVAAFAGDAVNYAIGYWFGPKVFKYEDSLLLNKKHLLRTQEFYERHGGKTIVLARFIPIIRTFAPFVAGIGKMNHGIFSIYNAAGGLAWVSVCLGAGVWFGQIPWVKGNFELVVIGIIVVSILPLVVEFFNQRRQNQVARAAENPHQPLPSVKEKAG
ncbi:MAG: DedA family protein [Gemmataceae bacterium]|nr:DedA family protein [Gemmataceae bacterium]